MITALSVYIKILTVKKKKEEKTNIVQETTCLANENCFLD